MSLTQGQHLNDRYWIAMLIEQGGFGAVYKAWDITLNRPVAIKEGYELSAEGQRQFLREAQILASLAHPNLPRVIDFFTIPEQGAVPGDGASSKDKPWKSCACWPASGYRRRRRWAGSPRCWMR